ncbi:hypothetical protein K469DRAFT_552232 [Zopfia rhizophila CBS 207.26]|uniref:FHA domain-containing protein n=1 Tax=Zopfia rhizophila CBS 207.26 TaxID=1314779 RepID=A0A6A6ETS8_9PEZI|nr:hypothetical protein K469DRAFT_552232 [Zopfia rhizophila CBS 207.26]
MDSSPGSQAAQLPSNTTTQQPEPTRRLSLLPAFEPLSSSPFPRPQSAKRKFAEDSPSFPKQQLKYYPTPVPTSSTGILPSSSPQNVRPGLTRSISTLSERVPLGAVPSIDLSANGEYTRMGRSSNSSDYQLSANRLISRVHVQAAYHAPSALSPNGYVEVECLGWNGAKIHCRGQVYELEKGESYVSDNPEAEIMLDVQDARVMIVWPATGRKLSFDSENGDEVWNDDDSPIRRPAQDHFASSPPVVPRSPVSQSPIRQPNFIGLTAPSPVQVYEDADPGENNANSPTAADTTFVRPSLSRSVSAQDPKASQSSALSSFHSDDFSDGDEENDPVVHSFGPFGENLLPRLASFSTATPTQSFKPSERRRRPLRTSQSPQQRSSPESVRFKESPIKNHVINQLAFSRLHSIPLSAIHNNLPAELKACATKPSDDKNNKSSNSSEASTPIPRLSTQDLKKLMDDIPCVGEIPRSGKDAAGKPLENEFYYVPEMDSDQMRRDAVTGGMRGPGLRAVRKSHKQYYWKRPRF